MRLRHITGSEEKIKNSSLVVQDIDFVKDKQLKIELGMGKGDFIIQNALKYPDICFIGIEKYATIILKAIDKVGDYSIDNMRFMCIDGKELLSIFPPKRIQTIYLNFSDPWPKSKHEKRRLTYKSFLSIYKELLCDDGTIEFKTDNIDLFNYSLLSFQNNNWEILKYTYDLHNDASMNENNIMTEYERKFSLKGNKICKLVAKVKEEV